METPNKGKYYKRFVTTTAATQKNDTIFITINDEKRSRIKTQIFGEISSIKKRIHFQSENEQICNKMAKNQHQIQSNYRKNMVNYLNTKFGEAIAQIKKKPQQNSKIVNNEGKDKQQKVRQRIGYAFKEFIFSVREQNGSYLLSQFQIGNIFKGMNFIQNLLDERSVVLKICRQLQHLTITSLFMFILHFHTLHSVANKQDLQYQIIELIYSLFEAEGFKENMVSLERYYVNGERMSKMQQLRFMRFNRQNRQTSSSISYSVNRKK